MRLRNFHIVKEDFFLWKRSLVPQAKVPLDSIKKEWCSHRLTRFHRGSTDGYVMNNNGLESTNKVFKDSGTLMKRTAILEYSVRAL